ncbi:MAG TPA: hypothetical protein VHG08_16190 [Longimicrobium sp.]|nr:hypothetical protein [Longimicrobium sp.]
MAPVLNRLFFTNYALVNRRDGSGLLIQLVVAGEAALGFPGVESLAIVFGTTDAGATLLDTSFFLGPRGFSARVDDVTVGLRFPPSILKPVPESPGATPPPYAQIEVHGAISLDESFNLHLEGFDAFSLRPVMIGNSGIIISAEDVKLDLSRTGTLPEVTAAGFDESFMGVYIGEAKVQLPDDFPSLVPEDLVLKKCVVGSGGVSGRLEAHYSPAYDKNTKVFSGHGAGALFGIPFGLEDITLEVRQNTFKEAGIEGKLLLPFFDEPVEVDIGIGMDGGFSARLTSTGPNGLYKLTRPDLLEMELDSIGFGVKDGVFVAKLSGEITPLFGKDQGLVWPAFKVEELSIDSKGHVKLEGGWLALRQQYELNLYGFKLSITRLGFGTTNDGANGGRGRWMGFSGGLKLVDGFTAGASVEGLRITWYDDGSPTKLSFNGIGVELEIPDVLYFKGAVSYRDLVIGGQPVRRFDGDIKLRLIALELEIDAKVVFGYVSGGPQGSYNFFAIYLGVELPTGIPLGSLPLSLYGMAGLFALQMEPNRKPEDGWYEHWYKLPQPGVADLVNKWDPRRGSMALGGGVTIGTNDNGFTFACKALLVIVFPGPIILLEGKANLLKERAELDGAEPLFRSLSVLDLRQGQVLMGLDARYRQDEANGRVIDIRAGAEAFFHTPDDWHLYLGEREPRDKRIRAEIFRLFEANAYFMLEPRRLATGAWVGYARSWRFGPVALTLEAWLEGNVVVSWNPVFFHGDVWLHGLVEAKVFGFGLGLGVDARVEVDAFRPFHLLARLEVYLKLPRPLKSKSVDVTLEWGPQTAWPPIPPPLKEVAVEHFKVTTSWPLVGHNSGGPPLAGAPVVPLDGRPHVGFRRPVHDDARVGINPQPVQPELEVIGDPATGQGVARVRYAVQEVALLKWDQAALTWRSVAVAGRPRIGGERALYGSWAPVPGMGAPGPANDKLWLWSRTPFDYTRHGGGQGDDGFLAGFPDYPCVPRDVPDREVCCDFERMDRAHPVHSPWRPREQPEITVTWPQRGPRRVVLLAPPVDGFTQALCLPTAAAAEVRSIVDVRPVPLERLRPEVAVPGEEPAAREAAGPRPIATAADPGDDALARTGPGVQAAVPLPADGITIQLSRPASRVRVWFVAAAKPARVCLDFRARPRTVVPLPLREQGVALGAAGEIGTITPVATTLGDLSGLSCTSTSRPGTPPSPLEITLPCAATTVELVLSRHPSPLGAAPVTVTAFDAAGRQVAARETVNPVGQPEMVRFEGGEVRRIRISPAAGMAFLHQLCFVCAGSAPTVTAVGLDREGRPTGRAELRENTVEVSGEGLWRVRLGGPAEVCLLRICATLGPTPREVARREEMAKHLASEVARWQQAGEVLEPFSHYRLRIVTTASAQGLDELGGQQHLTESTFFDFRTEGPPGLARLSVPPGQTPESFESGLDDLTRYVRQTTPPTVPAPGQKPVMAKPFYRAFDVGVDFDEDYVDLMYRISGRDLGLYLYDANNRPVRDAQGRLLVQSGEWGAVGELTLTEGEERWVALSERANGCLPKIDRSAIVRDRRLTSAVPGRVLEPDTVYEARLIPLLLRDFFRGYAPGDAAQGPAGRLGRWRVHDAGDTGGPSRWEVRETPAPAARYLAQTSAIRDGAAPADPAMHGTVLVYGGDPSLAPGHPEHPAGWTDVRVSAYARTDGGGAMGLVFRWQDGGSHYRFSLECGGALRRLVRVAGGTATLLAEDAFACQPGRDYLLTVEAVGSSLRAYQDGALVFDAVDAAHAQGSVGLYAYDNPDARFADVRVDDFRAAARPAYRFQFTTSRFASFVHHLHSYQDETWRVALTFADVAGVLPAVQRAVPPATAPGEDEARAYAAVADTVLGPAARKNPPEVQVTRVEVDGTARAFLVQGPEPIDWLRTEISLRRTPYARTEPALPGRVKLTGVRFAAGGTHLASVDVLLREAADLAGYRVESRLAAWPLRPESGVAVDARALAQDAAAHAWTPCHAFAPAGTLPAGTLLRLAADPPDATPVQLAALDARSVSRAWRILFSREVRIVAPDGTVVHARHFLPDEDYVPLDVNVLRKADGTGLFVLMPGAAPFPLAQYRLALTYRRDNRSRVPGSPVWSQAGDTGPEIVTLDIPLQSH